MDVLQGAWGTLVGMGRAVVLHTAARTRRHHSVGRVLGRLAMGFAFRDERPP